MNALRVLGSVWALALLVWALAVAPRPAVRCNPAGASAAVALLAAVALVILFASCFP